MHWDETSFLRRCGDTWNTLLGLSLEPLPGDDAASDEPTLTSSIPINGEWLGALQLRCPESVARHAAVMLLSLDDEQVTHGDLQDAMNELARRIAEGLDGLLPPSSRILAPASTDDPARCQSLVAMLPASELRLSCEGRPVGLRILHAGAD